MKHKQRKIKKIFDAVFKYPNPIFCHPLAYFKHKNYLCEIARSKTIRECEWGNNPFKPKNPLLILEGLFVCDGFFITVLERVGEEFVHRTDLSGHINSKKEFNQFIYTNLNK